MEPQDKDEKEGQPGSPYESPKVVRISLRPHEAVLGHCKVTGASGPVGGGCRSVGMPCKPAGS